MNARLGAVYLSPAAVIQRRTPKRRTADGRVPPSSAFGLLDTCSCCDVPLYNPLCQDSRLINICVNICCADRLQGWRAAASTNRLGKCAGRTSAPNRRCVKVGVSLRGARGVLALDAARARVPECDIHTDYGCRMVIEGIGPGAGASYRSLRLLA